MDLHLKRIHMPGRSSVVAVHNIYKNGNDLLHFYKYWYNLVMKNNKSRISVVSETKLGVYVWKLSDDSFVSDEDANVMSISAFKGDLAAIAKIRDAARYYGFSEGEPVFLEGARKITDEELQEQIDRMNRGLVPDPYDIGVYKEELKFGDRRV